MNIVAYLLPTTLSGPPPHGKTTALACDQASLQVSLSELERLDVRVRVGLEYTSATQDTRGTSIQFSQNYQRCFLQSLAFQEH
jgi:hypothetical protein